MATSSQLRAIVIISATPTRIDQAMGLLKSLSKNKYIGRLFGGIISNQVSREAETISSHFARFLKAQIAITNNEKKAVYRIRHKVYCEELEFEPRNKDEEERDEYDDYSIFGLIKHIPSDEFTGCVRVVSPQTADQLLPIEKYCAHAYRDSEIKPSDFKRHKISEISRLAVLADFRRRKEDKYQGAATGVINERSYSLDELRCFPFISVGLYLTAASIAIERGCDHCFVMMEPRLARSMSLIGIKFTQLGEPVEYHGLRAPYYINGKIFLENLSPGFKSLHESIDKAIQEQLKAL